MKITEVSVQKNNDLKVNVFIDGKYRLSLDGADAALRGIRAGRELNEKELNNLLMDSEYAKALDNALSILSRKGITSKELEKKLAQKGYDMAVIGEVIAEVTSLGYIDDSSYAAMFLEYSLEKLWGKKKIRYEMKNKGIDDSIIEEVLSSYDEDALLELLVQYIIERYSDFSDIKTKARITRHFASRGFDFSLINTAIAMAAEEISNE